MKIVAINGSPRKSFNTAQICEKVLEGAETKGAEVEMINLYDLDFKGCISCFACHIKGNDDPLCVYNDELKEVLSKCLEADALVIGSPIYYGAITGATQSFLERLLFAADTYYIDENNTRVSKLKKNIKTLMVYTMNVDESMAHFNGEEQLRITREYINNIIGDCDSLYVYDTYQFKNYDYYLNNMFDPEHKLEVKEKQFPLDCQKAFDMGVKLVEEN